MKTKRLLLAVLSLTALIAVHPRRAAGAPPIARSWGVAQVVTATLVRPADVLAYAIGDAVADSTTAPTLLTFAGCARYIGGTGRVISLTMLDTNANPATPISLQPILFDAPPTPIADNTPLNLPQADVDKVALSAAPTALSLLFGVSPAGGVGALVAPAGSPAFTCQPGSTSLYLMLRVGAAYTPISAERFTFRLQVLQD